MQYVTLLTARSRCRVRGHLLGALLGAGWRLAGAGCRGLHCRPIARQGLPHQWGDQPHAQRRRRLPGHAVRRGQLPGRAAHLLQEGLPGRRVQRCVVGSRRLDQGVARPTARCVLTRDVVSSDAPC